MKLIIAEKPAQAKNYADALGGFERKDGYFQSKDAYITWCFGHLIQLEEDTAYRDSQKWDLSYLPLIPETYKYCIGKGKDKKPDEGKKKQLSLIQKLAGQSTEIINGTDADREGELIFLYVYNYLKLTIPYKRLWISSLTKGDIIKGFDNLLSAKDVELLGKAGYARAISDWLVGINGTQTATLKLGNGNLLSIGRVQTAILKIICERWLKNKNFQSTFTYKIKAEHKYNNVSYFSNTEIFESKEVAENILKGLNANHSFKEKKSEVKKVNPPLLYSIDTLIVDANKMFGFSGQDTLNIAQSLYEKKLTTYPRTDSNYINEENYGSLKKFLGELSTKTLGIDYEFGEGTPKSVNAKKLTGSHDAIVPTGEFTNYNTLSEKEKEIYHLIIRRCLESFSVSAVYNKNKYIFVNNGVEFFTYTSVLAEKGWKSYSFQPKKNNEENEESEEIEINLDFQEGEQVNVVSKNIMEIESKPPQLYTDANLTPDLVNIGKFIKEENPELLDKLKNDIDLSDVQIGTQATRPSIIERLKKLELIKIEKKKYVPTEKGLAFYNTIKELEVSNIANTALLEKQLKDIAEGKVAEQEFYNSLKEYVKKIVEDILNIKSVPTIGDKKGKNLGICPKCKKGVIEEKKQIYGCSEYKNGCDFVISKTIGGKNITDKQVKDLIEKGVTSKIKGFQGKRGEFEAKLKINDDFKIGFYFEKK